jgi:excisionase family DNA binding protein
VQKTQTSPEGEVSLNPPAHRIDEINVMNNLIGTKEAALKLGISLRRVQQLIEIGTLPAKRIGRDYLIQEKDLSKVTVHGKPGRPKKEA